MAGVSSHPGKFGFVAFHNLLRFGYRGEVYPLSRDGADILGRRSYRKVSEVPRGAADLVFVCTPNRVNVGLLRECAAVGVRADPPRAPSPPSAPHAPTGAPHLPPVITRDHP